MARILVIEDDEATLLSIEQGLKHQGHIVESSMHGTKGLEKLLEAHYDLAIIDWDLPGTPGIDICNRYRMNGGGAAVLFLTGKQQISNKVQAFDCGADDYLCKPFAYPELLVRVRALLKRPQALPDMVLSHDNIKLDLNTSIASCDGQDLKLTAGEFAMMELFIRNPGRTFTANELLQRVFKSESDLEAVRVRVMRLRKKMKDGSGSERIVNVKGFGYKLE